MKSFSTALLDWYDKNARSLPWRDVPTPYHVWLSEIMLQQTRIEAVRERYILFLRRFPTIESLAEAEEEEVLKLWEGMGYYSRARNLHKAAKTIMEVWGGKMPSEPKDLQTLPGVGDYTSKAISSIAFQKPQVSVDGNLLRVYARLTCCSNPTQQPEIKKLCEQFFLVRIDKNRPGDFNQALMDLGEIVCLPNGAPLCEKCPFQECCSAHAKNREEDFPVMAEKKAKKEVSLSVFLLRLGDRYAVRKRPPTGLLASMYELPNVEGGKNDSALDFLLGRAENTTDLGLKTHIFTHLKWNMHGFLIELKESVAADGFVWATKKELEEKYALPTAFRQFLF